MNEGAVRKAGARLVEGTRWTVLHARHDELVLFDPVNHYYLVSRFAEDVDPAGWERDVASQLRLTHEEMLSEAAFVDRLLRRGRVVHD